MTRLLLAVLSVLAIMTVPVWGAQLCFPLDKFEDTLWDKWQERRVGQGINLNSTRMLRLYRSQEGETWTVLVVNTDKIACHVASGKQWQSIEFIPPDTGS